MCLKLIMKTLGQRQLVSFLCLNLKHLMREYPLYESSFVYTNPAFSFTKSEQRSKNSLMVAVKQ